MLPMRPFASRCPNLPCYLVVSTLRTFKDDPVLVRQYQDCLIDLRCSAFETVWSQCCMSLLQCGVGPCSRRCMAGRAMVRGHNGMSCEVFVSTLPYLPAPGETNIVT